MCVCVCVSRALMFMYVPVCVCVRACLHVEREGFMPVQQKRRTLSATEMRVGSMSVTSLRGPSALPQVIQVARQMCFRLSLIVNRTLYNIYNRTFSAPSLEWARLGLVGPC